MNRSRPIAALALVTCFATLAHAQDLEKPDVKLIGIEEHHLPNGLRIVFLADPTKPTFTTNLTVLVGSVHEGAGETGMAHVFEHILFRSAEGFPDISETLKELGGNFNGTTSFDRTNFFETLNATDENFETAIRLEAARLGKVTISEDFLEKEGRIVESEFDIGETSAQRVLLFGAFGAMFDFHGYSRSPIGTVEDFKSLTVKGVKAFYKRYYRPDNAVLFITGKFDRVRAMELVKKHFGGFKASGKGRPTYTTREPAARGERRYTVRGPGDTSHVLMAYRAPGAASPEAAAAQVLAQALVAGKSGPLYDAIVGSGLASSVEGGMMTLRMPSPLLFMAEVPKDKDAAAVEAALIEELEKKAAQLPEADLVRAKSQIEREFDDAFNSAEAMAMVLSEYEASGSWQLFVVRREQVKAVTLEEVRAFAAKYLRAENRVVGRYLPDPAAVKVRPDPEPEVGEYSALLAGVPAGLKGTKEFAYTPASIQAALETFEVGPATFGLIRKENRGDDVFVRLFLPVAEPAAIRGSMAAADALAALATERTKSLGKDELAAKLAELKGSIHVTASTEGVVVAITAKKATFAEVAALAVGMLRTPEVGEEALKDYAARTAGQIKAKADDPQALIPEALGRMVFAEGDPRRPQTAEEELAAVGKLKVDDVLAFHREFLGAQGMLGSVVGDVAREDVVRLFTPLVADWKAAKAPATAPMPGLDGCASPHSRILTPGKPAAFVALVQPLRLNAKAADHLALDAASWALFGDALSSRIPSKVREEAALSYMTMGVVQAPLYGDAGVIVVFSATKPVNAPKVLGMIRDELALALKDGITEKELASWRKSYGNRVVSARSDDSALGAAWIELRRAGLDFTFWAGRDKAASELKLDEVNAALRKYLQPAKAGLLEIGDFKEDGDLK